MYYVVDVYVNYCSTIYCMSGDAFDNFKILTSPRASSTETTLNGVASAGYRGSSLSCRWGS